MDDGAVRGRVLVTGAAGNVGRAVARHLVDRGQAVISVVRSAQDAKGKTEQRAFDFDDHATWPAAL